MFKNASFLAIIGILALLSMAPVMCVVDDSNPNHGFAPYPGTVFAMSPRNIHDYGFTNASDTLVTGDDIIGYTFDTQYDDVVIVSCQPTDVYMDPVIDLYDSTSGDPDYFATAHGNGYFSLGTSFFDDALIIFDSYVSSGTYDVVTSAYTSSRYGDFFLEAASLPLNDTDYLGSRARDGLVTANTYVIATLPDAATTQFYYFSVDWASGAPVVLFVDVYDDPAAFNPSLILRGLNGEIIDEGTLVAPPSGFDFSAEIDFTTGLDAGTYILEVSSDDANYGDYRVGISFE